MSLEFILQLTYSTCYNRFSSSLIDRDPDSLFAASWTYEDGWKLLLHDTYYTTSSTTQNPLTSFSPLAEGPRVDIYLWFEDRRHFLGLLVLTWDSWATNACPCSGCDMGQNEVMYVERPEDLSHRFEGTPNNALLRKYGFVSLVYRLKCDICRKGNSHSNQSPQHQNVRRLRLQLVEGSPCSNLTKSCRIIYGKNEAERQGVSRNHEAYRDQQCLKRYSSE